MTAPRAVLFFANGNTAAFDNDDQQMPDLQNPWLLEYVKFLESRGVDPAGIDFKLPSGRIAKLFKTSEGAWSWEIKQ